MKKYAILTIIICITGYIGMNFASGNQDLLEKTVEYNNWVYAECFKASLWVWQYWAWTWSRSDMRKFSSDTIRYKKATDCWKSQRKFTPDDLFLTVPKYLVDEGKCAISQSEDDHVRPERGGMYATDIACNFKEQGVYAPDYLDEMKEYKIEETWYDNLLGNFVILSFPDWPELEWVRTRWYFWHTVLDKGWKVGDTVITWVRFAHADLSGATTGWHTHIELRRMYDGIWQSVRYVTRSKERKLEEKRLSKKASVSTGSDVIYYFTHYAFVEWQTDSTPCIWADGKDSCLLLKHGRWTMALTVDIRKKLGIVFGDKVALTGDVGCEGVYTVTDEMACRFRGEYAWANGPCSYSDWTLTPRISHIRRPWTSYYIKGDLPGRPGWACSISKL